MMAEFMLWHTYPEELDTVSLKEAYDSLQGDPPSQIPFLVWLLENPNSPFALPGCIDLFGHDCMHLLLKQGFSPTSEAYVVGFTMGNDQRTTRLHLWIFRFMAQFFYPQKYRLQGTDIQVLEQGFEMGRRNRFKNINQCTFTNWQHKTLQAIRAEIGLEFEA